MTSTLVISPRQGHRPLIRFRAFLCAIPNWVSPEHSQLIIPIYPRATLSSPRMPKLSSYKIRLSSATLGPWWWCGGTSHAYFLTSLRSLQCHAIISGTRTSEVRTIHQFLHLGDIVSNVVTQGKTTTLAITLHRYLLGTYPSALKSMILTTCPNWGKHYLA